MDAAQAVEAAGRVPTAPALHGGGPFLGLVVLGEPLECADRAAVQERGAHGVEFPGQRGDGGLVQDGESLLEVSLEDEDASLGVPTQDPCCRVAQSRPDVDGPAGVLQGSIEVPCQDGRPGEEHRELTMDRRVRMVDQQVLGTPDPPSRGRQESRVQEQGGHLPRRFGPRLVLAGPHSGRVNALPGVDGDLRMARHVRGIRERRERIPFEPVAVIGFREELVRLVPAFRSIASRARSRTEVDSVMDESVSDPWRRVERPQATQFGRLRHVDKVARWTAVDEDDA